MRLITRFYGIWIKADIQYWLVKFVAEAKRKDGNYYPPNTMYQIPCGLGQALRNAGCTDLDIFDGAEFAKFRDTLDACMKQPQATGAPGHSTTSGVCSYKRTGEKLRAITYIWCSEWKHWDTSTAWEVKNLSCMDTGSKKVNDSLSVMNLGGVTNSIIKLNEQWTSNIQYIAWFYFCTFYVCCS